MIEEEEGGKVRLGDINMKREREIRKMGSLMLVRSLKRKQNLRLGSSVIVMCQKNKINTKCKILCLEGQNLWAPPNLFF